MGTLIYGSARTAATFDDRTLVHLQIVFGAKLRRGEPFFCSWGDGAMAGGGRSSIWVARAVPIMFHFDSTEPHAINGEWLNTLLQSANEPQGLALSAEVDRGNTE